MIDSLKDSGIRALQLDNPDTYLQTSLRMVLLLLVLFVNDIFLAEIVIPLLIVPGILISRVLLNRYYWLMLASVFTVSYLILGIKNYLPNHKYIFAFLLIGITIILFVKHYGGQWRDMFVLMARWMIGFCFLFATIGKFLAPEFLDGSFFEFTCLSDERFHGMTSLLTGISTSELYNGYTEFMTILTTSDVNASMVMPSAPILSPFSLVLSYWTIFIEGMIAISFLAPQRSFLHRYREWFLMAFIITTYPIATVPGFATTLAILAFIQTYKNEKANNYSLVYLLIFLAIPLFRLPFLRIWDEFRIFFT